MLAFCSLTNSIQVKQVVHPLHFLEKSEPFFSMSEKMCNIEMMVTVSALARKLATEHLHVALSKQAIN